MDTNSTLIRGLQSDPKYLPAWYRYDTQGSIYNDRCLTDNPYYYFAKAEVDVILQHIDEIIDSVPKPCMLVDLGSGNSEKSRVFIDAILRQQTTLRYIPVDISAEYLQAANDACSRDYGEKLIVTQVAGDYSEGFKAIRENPGNKLIIWLGSVQNGSYNEQVKWLRSLSQCMTRNDVLLLTLDVTDPSREDEILKAYLDPMGISEKLHLNVLWRLNREYGSNINTDDFETEAEFKSVDVCRKLSGVRICARSRRDQMCSIPGLGIDVPFQAGEPIYLHDGEYASCKYTSDQIRALVEQTNLNLACLYVDPKGHAAVCILRNQSN